MSQEMPELDACITMLQKVLREEGYVPEGSNCSLEKSWLAAVEKRIREQSIVPSTSPVLIESEKTLSFLEDVVNNLTNEHQKVLAANQQLTAQIKALKRELGNQAGSFGRLQAFLPWKLGNVFW